MTQAATDSNRFTLIERQQVSYEVSGKTLTIKRLKYSLSPLSLIPFLEKQSFFPKVYWESREGNEQAIALGKLCDFDAIPKFFSSTPTASHPRIYGGMDFFESKRKTLLWKGFPPQFFFLPIIEIVQNNDEQHLYVNLPANSQEKIAEKILESLDLQANNAFLPLDPPLNRLDNPASSLWSDKLEHLLHLIDQKQIEKVVLARSSTFCYPKSISPLCVLASIRKKAKNSTVFGICYNPHAGFVGATPELLYKRIGQKIETEAIAGTRPRGHAREEDESYKNELLNNEKEVREFNIVSRFIEKKLLDLCENFTKSERKVIQTKDVQHLKESFSGLLKGGMDDQTLIQALHPTPAMGGEPRDWALKAIFQLESFDRGWYAAPIGWITPDAAEIAVGIRSALIDDNFMHVFAGTGIVEGSCPKKEWEELEYKISQFCEGNA